MPFLEASLQQRVALQRIHQTPESQEKLNLFKHEWSWSMILKNLNIFSQNVQKNNVLINTVLEVNYHFNIIFIQESSWTTLRTISNSENSEGILLLDVPSHPNWLTFARELCSSNDSPRVLVYINIRLASLCFSLQKDI